MNINTQNQSNTIIAESVTAIIMVGDEVLVLRRSSSLRAFAGFSAFPGGRIDPCDDAPSPLTMLTDSDIPRSRIHALVREIMEELGFDLQQIAQNGELVDLAEIGYAVTPLFVGRRFATWFYRVRLSVKPPITLDLAEHTTYGWAPPSEWLTRYFTGRLLLAPPTLFTLQHLEEDLETNQLTRFAALGKPPEGYPLREIAPIFGVDVILVRSNTLPPAQHTNCFLVGDGGKTSPRLLIDPAPCDEDELHKLYQQVKGRMNAILITHHHPDHNERADQLARLCQVPLLMSADTHQRIRLKRPDFFNDLLKVQRIKDGEVVTHWLGHPVLAIATPGHDAGQVSLLPKNAAWCVVGDLIQGVGTVVIASPEGDMAQYFATLKKVIALKPRTIFPSHGLALGGVHYLEAALKHRQHRESQILECCKEGMSIDTMLRHIYTATPPPLLPYARLNILSHINKLKQEGKLT